MVQTTPSGGRDNYHNNNHHYNHNYTDADILNIPPPKCPPPAPAPNRGVHSMPRSCRVADCPAESNAVLSYFSSPPIIVHYVRPKSSRCVEVPVPRGVVA